MAFATFLGIEIGAKHLAMMFLVVRDRVQVFDEQLRRPVRSFDRLIFERCALPSPLLSVAKQAIDQSRRMPRCRFAIESGGKLPSIARAVIWVMAGNARYRAVSRPPFVPKELFAQRDLLRHQRIVVRIFAALS